MAPSVVLAYLLYEIWPAVVHATAETPSRQRITLFHGRIVFRPSTEAVLLLLAIVAGALGAYVHAATSFAKYVGTRRLGSSLLARSSSGLRRAGPDAEVAVDLDDRDEAAALARQLVAPIVVGA